jgi:PAS domain S-box-containing protein
MAASISALPRRPTLGVEHLPSIAGAFSIAIGCVALLGWSTGIDALKSILPGLLTMKVNTAVGFVLLGLGLMLRARPPETLAHRLGVVPIGIAMAMSLTVGAQYLSGRDFGIDQWLFVEPLGQVGTVQPNRMSPMTVIGFVGIGLAVLLSGNGRGRRAVPALSLGVIVVASLNVLDFVLEATTPSVLAGSTQMALNTAITMIVVSVGVMGLLPHGGPLEVFLGDSSSARLARRLVIASVAVPVVLAWLRTQGEDLGLYDGRYGTSLMVLGTFALLAAVIWENAWAARRTELDRLAALEERDRFFDVSIDLLVTASAAGYFERLNPAWTNLLGYSIEELCARPFVDFVHPDDVEGTYREVERQVAEGQSVLNFQNRYRHRDGSYRWLEWSSSPSADGRWLYAVARDITDRKLEEDRLQAPALALARRQAAARDRIQSIVDDVAFAPIFQPIVDLSSGRPIGFEALTRFADGSRPDETFATAIECGLGRALELATLAVAFKEARRLPRSAWLSVNVSPSLLADVDAMRPVLGMRLRPIVLEITEHETIAAYGPVRESVRALGPDVRLAVDDAGAGVANFNHLVELRPDFVKVDLGLVRGVDDDVSRQAVIAGILHFAAAAGCEVIAEGIETDAELATLTNLGVTLGQGFLLGRPAPAADWSGDRVDTSVVGARRDRRRAARLRPSDAIDAAKDPEARAG